MINTFKNQRKDSFESFTRKDEDTNESFKRKEEDNVCKNQNTFNRAFQRAVDDYKVPTPSTQAYTAFGILLLVYLVFLIWAVIIALRKEGPNQNLDILFAIIFSPFYVFSEILLGFKK